MTWLEITLVGYHRSNGNRLLCPAIPGPF